jgi:hypothetical protein
LSSFPRQEGRQNETLPHDLHSGALELGESIIQEFDQIDALYDLWVATRHMLGLSGLPGIDQANSWSIGKINHVAGIGKMKETARNFGADF